MIPRTDRVVVTFFTTTDAFALEQLCRECQMPGRLIPVPGSISADCGLAWAADPQQEPQLRALMAQHKVRVQGVYRCLV